MNDPYSALRDDYDDAWGRVWERDKRIAYLEEIIEAYRYLINSPPDSKEHKDAEVILKNYGEI